MQVSTSFVRNLRKSYLKKDGTPLEGQEQTADTLLHIHKALQGRNYGYAMELAKASGWNLEEMYEDYIASQKLGSTWRLVESACRKWGVPHIRWTNIDKEAKPTTIPSVPKRVKFDADRPFAR